MVGELRRETLRVAQRALGMVKKRLMPTAYGVAVGKRRYPIGFRRASQRVCTLILTNPGQGAFSVSRRKKS